MPESANRPTFIVQTKPGPFRARLRYEVRIPDSDKVEYHCDEPNLGFISRLFRWTDLRRRTPIRLEFRDAEGDLILCMRRGWGFFRRPVHILDAGGNELARLRRRKPRIGGQLDLLEASGEKLGTFQGKWHRMDFNFLRDDVIIATVSRRWSGLGKELIGSGAYALSWNESVADVPLPTLLAAVICIDRMFGV